MVSFFARLRTFFAVSFVGAILLLVPFCRVSAANEETSAVSGGPFSLASAWGGVFNVSGSSAALQSIGAGYTAGTVEGSLVVIPGDTLSFSHTSMDPSGTFGGGLFSGESLQGKWAASLSDRSQCSGGVRVFSVGADQYSFVLCGVEPAFSLSSNNSAVMSCSGMACTANSVGTARITMLVAGVPVKVWGMKSGESNWTELVSGVLPSATLSWSATVVLPPTLTISMSGTNPIPYDTSTTLSWSAQNVVESDPCQASGDWGSGTRLASGTYDTGNLQAQRSYTLMCVGPSGDVVTEKKVVQVGSPTPGPSVIIWAGASPVPSGTSTTISWTSSGADTCIAEGDWINPGPRPTNGSESTGPITSAKVYLIKCSNVGGTTPRSVAVDVLASIAAPSFRDFSANPNPIPYNGSTTLSWDVQNATSCSASSNAPTPLANWNGSVSPLGSRTISGLTSTTKFFLSCTGAGGTTLGDPVEVLVAPAGLQPPVISLSADDGVSSPIPYGTATVIHWSVSSQADSCSVSGGDAGWQNVHPNPGTTGNYTTGNLNVDTSFTINCWNLLYDVSSAIKIQVSSSTNPVDLSLWADSYQVDYGGSTTVHWRVNYAMTCFEENFSDGVLYWSGFESFSGDELYSNLQKPTMVRFTCQNGSGFPPAIKTITIDINSSTIPLPPPPSPPAPIVSLWESSSLVAYNTGTTLRWTVQNATSCTAYADPILSSWTGEKDSVSGSAITGNLRQDTAFYLQCWGPGGVGEDWAQVNVGNSSLSGPSLSFWADSFAVSSGGSTNLHWTSVGATGQCRASGDWSGNKGTSSAATVVSTGAISAPKTYRLTCSNAGGSITATVNILVGSTDPTASLSLWVDDPVVPMGGSTMLRWNAQNVTACSASAVGDPAQSALWSGSVPFVGGKSTGALTVNEEYTLTCKDASGANAVVKARVGVGSVFGSGPEMTLSADAYVVPPGTVPTLFLQTFFASACRMNDGAGTTMLLPSVSMTLDGAPYVEAITAPKTYTVECTDASDPLSPSALWNASRSLTIKIGRVLLCPASTDRNIILGSTLQFDAWYTENSSADCSTVAGLGGIDVTDSSSFETSWSVVSGGVTAVSGSPGLFRGTNPGPAKVRVTHRPNAALNFFSEEADLVVGRPVTCYRCDTSSFSCSSETQFDFVNDPAQCSSDTFGSSSACHFSCFKDRWEEVAP